MEIWHCAAQTNIWQEITQNAMLLTLLFITRYINVTQFGKRPQNVLKNFAKMQASRALNFTYGYTKLF